MKLLRLSLIFFFVLFACKRKDEDSLVVLPPDSVDAEFIDYQNITVETLPIDSVVTSGFNGQSFGKISDPYMGTLECTAYIQYLLSGTNVQFGPQDSIFLDSLELWLYVIEYQGDSSEISELKIYEITDNFVSDSNYYQFSQLNSSTQNVSLMNNFQVNLDSSGLFRQQVVKVKLSDDLGNKILFANSSDLTDNTTFRSFFKGLKIQSTNQNAVFSIAAVSDSSRLVLHYSRKNIDNSFSAKTYTFFSDYTGAAKFTNYTRNPSGSLLEQALQNPQTIGQQYSFLSCGNQTNIYLKINNIEGLQSYGVNKAELEFNIKAGSLGTKLEYKPVPIVYLYVADDNKKPSGLHISEAVFDYEKNHYNLRITEQMKDLILGRLENKGFVLVPLFPSSRVYRMVFGGPQNTSDKIRLKLFTTKIK